MTRAVWERFLAWSSVVLGGLLFVLESAYGLRYGETAAGLIIDYLAAGLLCYAGAQSLWRRPHGAAGLLFGAWSYALCDAYRAIHWRAVHYLGTDAAEPIGEPLGVFMAIVAAGGLTVFFFGLSLVLAHPRRAPVG